MARCLGVGADAAKTLAAATNKPIVGVHHMVSHVRFTWPLLLELTQVYPLSISKRMH